ncbi:NUDIX domain-containing protein [Halorussus salinisoli]|uniref:NUDIX domain-containing protein n=1 Tax=Halorussus salinisoli TaxID=2558242 RepID=UPI0010C1AB55|nr:NUDIX domain-containing protein [Halorussus salinisoli]
MTVRPADYCPDCGTETTAREIEGRERRYCESCARPVFQNPAPGTDVTVVDDDRVLLVERAAPPGTGEWTVPGGHMEADEHPRTAAVRELREETGVSADPDDLTLIGTDLLDPFRGKYVVNVGFAVPATDTAGKPTAESDASDVSFFTPDELDGDEYELRPHVRDRVDAALDALD